MQILLGFVAPSLLSDVGHKSAAVTVKLGSSYYVHRLLSSCTMHIPRLYAQPPPCTCVTPLLLRYEGCVQSALGPISLEVTGVGGVQGWQLRVGA